MHATGLVCRAPGALRLERFELPEARPADAVVRIRYGGVCGSDLHYWQHGRGGEAGLREPPALGHEGGGTMGTGVFVHAGVVCGNCSYCRSGRQNLCVELRYFGSAARFPHTPGAFASRIVVPTDRLIDVDGLAGTTAALIEPASVAWHAVQRLAAVATPLLGRVAVIGSGPIGLLVTVAVRARSAEVQVFSTDIAERPLEVARAVGATHTALARDAERELPEFAPAIVFETSGSRPGFALALRSVAPGGTVVAVGQLPPDIASSVQLIVGRELVVTGSSRFDHDATAVIAALHDGSLEVRPVVSHVFAAAEFEEAFAVAADSALSSKVLLDFEGVDR